MRKWVMFGFFEGLIVLLLSISWNLAEAETITVGYYENGFPPMFFKEGDTRTGIYVDILEEISKITHDRFVKEYAPVARILEQFGNGYDLEPGISPIWRPHQKDKSLYSIPFYHYQAALVMRRDKAFPVTQAIDLKGYRVGIIRGYYYPDWTPEDGNYIPDLATGENMLFEKFKAGRYDMMLVGVPFTKYFVNEYGLEIEIVHIIYSTDICFRLHTSRKSAVERINSALKVLFQNGTIETIIQKYLK